MMVQNAGHLACFGGSGRCYYCSGSGCYGPGQPICDWRLFEVFFLRDMVQ